ncbi:MAG: LamG domain-containing protein [Verrucomicrobia bacterium]|nr:LamG domain-containing protein [Verrucomicrobiota bacterium]
MKPHLSPIAFAGWQIIAGCLLLAWLACAQAQPAAGTALRFDGADDYVEVLDDPALNAYPITVTAWVKTAHTTNVYEGIVSKYQPGSGNGYSLHLYGGRIYAWYFRNGANRIYNTDPGIDGGSIADGHWHHIAFVVSPNGGSLYVDGNLRASQAWNGTPGATTSTESLLIGRYSVASLPFTGSFLGQIDEVTLWNRALTGGEVNYLKHRRLGGTEDRLLAYWRFDETAGAIAGNIVAPGLEGILVNDPAWVTSQAAVALEPVSGSALKLDGVDDHVSVPDAPDLNSYPLTVTAWVKTSRNALIADGIVSKYFESSLNGYSLFVYNGRVRGWYFRNASNRIWDGSLGMDGGFIADGNWHHIALVVDASGGRIVVDGVAGANMPWTGTPGATTSTEPLQIGRYWTYPNGFLGSIDEVTVWNRALSVAELQSTRNLLRTGSEPGLVAYWRFDEAIGASASDSTGLAHAGDLVNDPQWTGSTAFLGDGSVRLVAAPGIPTFTRFHAINSSGVVTPVAGQSAFQVFARGFFRRFHDYGPTPASVALVTRLDAALQTSSTASPIPVKPNTAPSNFNLSSYNASEPQPVFFGAVASISSTLNVEPDGAQLDSVNELHESLVTVSHSENGGEFTDDGNDTTGATRLLHFSGLLYSGDIPTTFKNLANTPAPGTVSAPDFLDTQLQLPTGAGQLLLRPEVTFGGGGVINVALAPDGTATNLNGTYTIGNLTPLTTAGVRYLAIGTLSPTGASATFLYAFLPAGLGVQTNPEIRAQYPYVIAPNVPLNALFEPASDPVIFEPATFGAGATQFHFAEETKPVLFSAPSIQWDVAVGQFYLPEATSAEFVRAIEDEWLERDRGFLQNPLAGERVSNDSFYRGVTAIPGIPIYILPDPVNGSARVQMQLELAAVNFRPHLPYTGMEHSGPVPSAGGRLAILDDLIDSSGSYLLLAGEVPIPYRRDCPDTNCSGVTLPPVILPFAPTPSPRLEFTPDGGLLAFGTVPAQNLTWGYTGTPDQFTQRTSDVEAGAYHMPGTFLRGDQTSLNNALRPAVLLFTGYGDPGDPTPERPGTAAYDAGFANYGGVNFRGPVEGRSTLAGRDTGWYPLVPQAKYYARYGGISGIHQAASFPSSFPLSGYDMTFSRFALSYLDSDNWESRTDGRITFPEQPAGFLVDFQRMKFLCRGALADAQLPPSTPEKHLNYWNADFLPLSMDFRESASDPCSVSNRFLVLGVETKLPFIPQKLHASLGFKPNGNLVVKQDNVRGADSRFPLPGQLSLQGSGGSFFTISTAGEGYFNNWATPGRPVEGFYNIAGRIDLPFFEDSKIHLHVTPITADAARIDIMGGWRATDKGGPQYGWRIGADDYFSIAKFDDTHRGFPERSVDGSRAITIGEYRNSPALDFHPRAQRNWIEVAIFDYPLVWNPTLRQFASFEDSTVILPIINVDSRLKELTPGKVDLDFAQDLELKLPRLKLLDLANDAVNEINGPLNSISNALRQAIGGAVDATGLTKGFRSMQRTLRDEMSGFFRPVLEPALEPVVNALYTQLANELVTNPANFNNRIASIVNDPAVGLQNAVRNINGVAGQGQQRGRSVEPDAHRHRRYARALPPHSPEGRQRQSQCHPHRHAEDCRGSGRARRHRRSHRRPAREPAAQGSRADPRQS